MELVFYEFIKMKFQMLIYIVKFTYTIDVGVPYLVFHHSLKLSLLRSKSPRKSVASSSIY